MPRIFLYPAKTFFKYQAYFKNKNSFAHATTQRILYTQVLSEEFTTDELIQPTDNLAKDGENLMYLSVKLIIKQI